MSIYVWTSEIKNIYVWTTPVKEVFVWTTKVRPSGWQPWANTIAYYKFDWDRLDYSWHWYNVTNAGSTLLWTYQWVSCLYCNNSYCQVGNIDTLTSYSNYTISVWAYRTGRLAIEYNDNWNWGWSWFDFRNGSTEIRWGNTTNTYSTVSNMPTNQWFNFVLTALNGQGSYYVNWVKTNVKTWIIAPSNNTTPLFIWHDRWDTTAGSWYVSNLIIEKTWWSQSDVTAYYNLTKSNYWL